MGFIKNDADLNLYYIFVGIGLLILVLYVDYLFLTIVDKIIVGWKVDMAVEFKRKEINMMHYFLGLEVWKKLGEILIG